MTKQEFKIEMRYFIENHSYTFTLFMLGMVSLGLIVVGGAVLGSHASMVFNTPTIPSMIIGMVTIGAFSGIGLVIHESRNR